MTKIFSEFLRFSTQNMIVVGVLALFLGISYCSAAADENGAIQYHFVCPKNFERVGQKCYHFSNSTASWFQAYYTCRDLEKSNLTLLSERYDQRSLEQYLFKNRSRPRALDLNSFWVGASKDWVQKKWVWSTSGQPVQFPSFKDINLNKREAWSCLLIDASRKKWRAEDCLKQSRFICETESKTYIEFKLYDKKFKRKISIDKCISGVDTLTKKQKKKCQKLLEGRNGNVGNDNHQNEPAAVMQKAAYPTQPTVQVISHICPQKWISLGNQCYLLSQVPATFSEAHFTCGQINSKLAMVRSKSQDQKLRIFLNGFTAKQERWIGGRYNSKKHEWIWASNGKQLKYKGFAKESLRNMNSSLEWQAIMMDPQYAYQWSFRNELEKKQYVCQVKGRTVKRLNIPRRPTATITILTRNNRKHRENNKKINKN